MKKTWNIVLLPVAVLTMMLAIFGPRLLTGYRDRNVLGRIREQEVDSAGAGYRYQLSSNEKLFILSECLNSQKRPEAEGSKPGREEETTESSYQEGTYAFVVNYEEETSRESFYASLNDGIALLKEVSCLPKFRKSCRSSMRPHCIRPLTFWSRVTTWQSGS